MNPEDEREGEGNDKHFLVGRVYPREQCFGNGPNKYDTMDITDNLPQNVMETFDLSGIPLTKGHPPGIDKKIKDAQHLIRGRVNKSFINDDGDLWAIAELDTNSLRGKLILEGVKNGREMGLSLGHVHVSLEHEGEVIADKHIPDHLGIVDEPRRPNCKVFHFVSKKDIPKMTTPEHIESLARQINGLPQMTTTIVNADSGSTEQIEVKSFVTCSLGTLDDPETMSFNTKSDASGRSGSGEDYYLPAQFELSLHRAKYGNDASRRTNRIEISTSLAQNPKKGLISAYFNNPQNKETSSYSNTVSGTLQEIRERSHQRHQSPSKNSLFPNQSISQHNHTPRLTSEKNLTRMANQSNIPPSVQQTGTTQSPATTDTNTSTGANAKDQGQDTSAIKGGQRTEPAGTNELSQKTRGEEKKTPPSNASVIPPGRITVESIEEEYNSMPDEDRKKAIAELMSDSKERRFTVRKQNEEIESLKKELAQMQTEKVENEKRESEKIDVQIAAYVEKISQEAQAVTEQTGGQVDPTSKDLSKEFQDLLAGVDVERKRKFISGTLPKFTESVQVASRIGGANQLEANKRRRVMSQSSGNDSIYSYRSNAQNPPGEGIVDFLNFGGGDTGSTSSPASISSTGRPNDLSTFFTNPDHGIEHFQYESDTRQISNPFLSTLTDEVVMVEKSQIHREMDIVNGDSQYGFMKMPKRQVKFVPMEDKHV